MKTDTLENALVWMRPNTMTNIYLLKCDLRKNDQNLNIVFISCDWPIPTFFLSVGNKQTMLKLHVQVSIDIIK